MKKSFVFIFCILFIILSVRIFFSEDLDNSDIDENIDENPAVEIITEVEENESEELEVKVLPEKTVQTKVQPKKQENKNVIPNQNQEVKKTSNSAKGVLLQIEDLNFKYSRIPDIKMKDVLASKNIIESKVEPNISETELNINDTKPPAETVNKESVINRIFDTDVLAKIALLLFVGGVIAVYKLKSSRSLKKRKVKFKKKKS